MVSCTHFLEAHFHLNFSSFSFWSLWCFPWAAHTCLSLVCPGSNWLWCGCQGNKPGSAGSQPKPAQLRPQLQVLISFIRISGESYSPTIWDNSRQTRFSCSVNIPAALLSVFQNFQCNFLTQVLLGIPLFYTFAEQYWIFWIPVQQFAMGFHGQLAFYHKTAALPSFLLCRMLCKIL